jgi:phage tail-like protein
MAMSGASRYIDYLPAILQQGRFIGPFLLGFERILSGPPADSTVPPGPEGIGQVLDRVHTFMNPLDPGGAHAPDDFLPWLAGWVATSLEDEWSADTKRAFISRVVQMYKTRGTANGLRDLLNLHGLSPAVYDPDDDAIPPYFDAFSSPHVFAVVVDVTSGDPVVVAKRIKKAVSIINQWKPAHTYYVLDYTLFGMQINRDSCTPRLLLDPNFTWAPCNPDFGPGIQIGVNSIVGTGSAHTIKLQALEINDDPSNYPLFGEGIFVGINTLLGTEP